MDTVLRNGLVVDGTGGPGVITDVGIAGGRIVVIGDLSDESAAQNFDLAGLVLAPGFIDIHTHYDAQVLWDPDLTPSSWHGITSVVMGNCGFGVAPLRAADSELLRDVLCTVEGMPPATVDAIVGQDFPSVAAYLEVVERRRPRLNVGVLVGHSALRVYSMGASALDRSAREAEMDEMASALRAAMDGGALGLATSRSPGHLGPPGRPVPSRLAALDELERLATVLADAGRGVIQVTPGPDFFLAEMGSLSARIGRPITWAALLGSMAEFWSPTGPTRTGPRPARRGRRLWRRGVAPDLLPAGGDIVHPARALRPAPDTGIPRPADDRRR